MRTKRTSLATCLTIAGLGLLAAMPLPLPAQSATRPPGWSDATHGARVTPDYERLFATDRVHTIHIRIAPEDFQAMQADLATIRPGSTARIGGVPVPGIRGTQELLTGLVADMRERLADAAAACANLDIGAACALGGNAGRCQNGPAMEAICSPIPALPMPAMLALPTEQMPDGQPPAVNVVPIEPELRARAVVAFGTVAPVLTLRDPIYVPVSVSHDGSTWTAVGMRYKGNSSLSAASMGRSGKVPFRLDFDRYEDEFPGTRNQRFYGFHKLTFASNFSDDSMLKEVLATEAFRDQGVPAARAAFYRIFVDTGAGDEYWGLYTMIEDPADGAMLAAQFGDDGGNLYKPNGPGANWSLFNPAGFEKKSNEEAADFSDVEAAIAALHAAQTDSAAWRAGLEARFDVDGFLRWLAVNTLIGNWDAYGRMAHNYYLYGDPQVGGRLRWIPWDHNLSFAVAGRGRSSGAFGMPGGDMLHRDAGNSWPLISRLMNDPVYAARYRELLELALDGLTAPGRFEARVSELHELIAPFAVGEQGERAGRTTLSSPLGFQNSPEMLIGQARELQQAAREALAARN